MPATLRERFRGCLLGLAVGDALGGLFEAQSAEWLGNRFASVAALLDYPTEEIWYTDDTQMALGVAEALLESGAIREPVLCARFVANYLPSRGYGRGARAVLDAMEEGRDYRTVAERYFPGGSFGNGAAMRVAPVGMFFHDDPAAVLEQARLSALPTHLHPLGVEGAQLVAVAVAWAVRADRFEREGFFAALDAACTSDEFRGRIARARQVSSPAELAGLGNGIAAVDSVPTALASFALTPESYGEAVGNVILLGGDTDTLAAMAGGISGAYLGERAIPPNLLGRLESSPKGRGYIAELADRLYAARGSANRG